MESTIIKIVIMIIVGGIIGYVTNVVAIILLFRPYEGYKIPILGLEVIGLIPKRRKEIAKSIGDTVKKELLSIEEIHSKLLNDANKKKLVDSIRMKLKEVVSEKTVSIPFGLGSVVENMVDDLLEVELTIFIYDQADEMLQSMTKEIDVSQMVEEKINQFELKKIEEIILNVAKKELRHIEQLGGLLGGLIGLIQGIVITLINYVRL